MRLVDKTIFVVDDQADQRTLVRKILESAGSNVVECTGVKDTLAKLARANPDLIILDMNMPEHDGLTLLRFRQQNKLLSVVPVLVLSGVEDQMTVSQAMALGASFYLAKPLRTSTLLQRLRKIFFDADNIKIRFPAGKQPVVELQAGAHFERASEDVVEIYSPIKLNRESSVTFSSPPLRRIGVDTCGLHVSNHLSRVKAEGYVQTARLKGLSEDKLRELNTWIRTLRKQV